MRLILIPLLFFFIPSQAISGFKKIQHSKIDDQKLVFAEKIGHQILDGQKNKNYHLLTSDEATLAMSSAMTKTYQKDSYNKIKDLLGDYESMVFEEAYASSSGPILEIYRFKGTFSASPEPAEIRVVLNYEKKIAGFFVIPWKNSLQ